IEAGLPAFWSRRAELDVARGLAAVIANDHGQLTVSPGISLAAEPSAFAGQCQSRLAEDRDAKVEIRRSSLTLGVQHELVVARWGVARQCNRGLDVLRFAGLDRDACQLLAAIGFGKGHLEILWRVRAEVDRGI